MLTLSNRQQTLVVAALALAMLITRSQHWASPGILPDASWAIFFLLGATVRARWVFPALIAASVMIDYLVTTYGGVSDYCLSPAYWLLFPAYLALHQGGRFYARRHALSWRGLMRLAGIGAASVLVAEAFSSGGFYLLSGRFSGQTAGEFLAREALYFPPMLFSFALYLGLAVALTLAAVSLGRGLPGNPREH